MTEFQDERQLVMMARSHLSEWTMYARREAYNELFEGEDPLLTPRELRILDSIDSEWERRGGEGVWGTDQYGIVTAGALDTSGPPRVVCTYHPKLPEENRYRGEDKADDETEERINDALWRYSGRVSALIENRLEEFVRQRQG